MANLNLNKVIIAGHITADPELKQTQGGTSVTNFSVAVNRRTKQGEEQKTDFFNVIAWRNTAEFVSRYFRKGSSICVTGELQNRSWTDNQGNKRNVTEIVASECMFVDSKSEGGGGDQGGYNAYTPSAPAPNFEDLNNDEDLPF